MCLCACNFNIKYFYFNFNKNKYFLIKKQIYLNFNIKCFSYSKPIVIPEKKKYNKIIDHKFQDFLAEKLYQINFTYINEQ